MNTETIVIDLYSIISQWLPVLKYKIIAARSGENSKIWNIIYKSSSKTGYSGSARNEQIKQYLIQNNPAVKKCAVPKKTVLKKDVKSKWRPRNGCDVRVKAKILIMTNLGEIGAES